MNNDLNPKHKIIMLVFSCFLFFVLLETALRIGGLIFTAGQEQLNRKSIKENGQYRIVCVGESTTALGGANSYPSQLEKILNSKNPGVKVSVVNKGVPGVDTDGIIESLPKWLAEYDPQMVIAMMGINDNDRNLAKVIKPYQKPSFFRSKSFLGSLKIYNLATYLYRNIKLKISGPEVNIKGSLLKEELDEIPIDYKTPHEVAYQDLLKKAWAFISEDRPQAAIEAFKQTLDFDDSLGDAYYGLGFAYFCSKNYADAENMYFKSIKLGPKDTRAYLGLGQLYIQQGRLSQAEQVYRQAYESNSYDARWPAALASLYRILGDQALAAKYYRIADTIRLQYYVPMSRLNYRKLKKITDKARVQLVCVQYPVRSAKSLEKIFEGTDAQDVIFVDNEKVFKDAIKNSRYEEYFWDFFGGDFGHCTPKGDKLLANNIAEIIVNHIKKSINLSP